jgi:hypothetical protein
MFPVQSSSSPVCSQQRQPILKFHNHLQNKKEEDKTTATLTSMGSSTRPIETRKYKNLPTTLFANLLRTTTSFPPSKMDVAATEVNLCSVKQENELFLLKKQSKQQEIIIITSSDDE